VHEQHRYEERPQEANDSADPDQKNKQYPAPQLGPRDSPILRPKKANYDPPLLVGAKHPVEHDEE
jgi:hypothetical protein